jgi:hypothetical protein
MNSDHGSEIALNGTRHSFATQWPCSTRLPARSSGDARRGDVRGSCPDGVGLADPPKSGLREPKCTSGHLPSPADWPSF